LRFLHGEAVDGAAFPDDVAAVDGDDFAVGKEFVQKVEGVFVASGLAVGGDEDGLVED
jgi:hypothetical protein